MLTLNSKALKIGNKWLTPINGSGPVPETESYLLRVWTSHDMRVCFQKLILNDVDPTTVDYSVLPSGKRPTQVPVTYCPPLVNNITLRFAFNNDSYSLNSQIQEFVNGGNVDTDTDYSSILQDHRYDTYVDLEFEWPYSFPIQSTGSINVYNGYMCKLYKIVNDTHYAEIASSPGAGGGSNPKTFSIDQTVYDVNADSSLSLWPSAGAPGDVLQIDWTPPSNQSLSSFSVNGGTVSNGLLTVGNSTVTLQANYGSYASYSSYELEMECTNHESGNPLFYISNMSVTPASGTVTSQYGTEALNSSRIASITGDGPYNMTSGYGYCYKINLFFGSLNSQYISWNSYLAKNSNYPCVGGTVTARLYGYNNGVKYPLGITSYNPNNILYNYKVSRCTDPNNPVYTVTTSASNGTVTATPPGGVAGTTCTLTATPNSGYTFDSYTLTGTGASISGNTLTIGTSNVTVVGNFVQGASYNHYELEIRNDTTAQNVAICGMNVRPNSGSIISNSTSALSTEDIDKIVDSTVTSQVYEVNLSPANGQWVPAKYLLLRFNSLSGNLTWYDTLYQYYTPQGGFSSATLYGVDSNNNRTQLSQIGPVTNTYNVQHSLHV